MALLLSVVYHSSPICNVIPFAFLSWYSGQVSIPVVITGLPLASQPATGSQLYVLSGICDVMMQRRGLCDCHPFVTGKEGECFGGVGGSGSLRSMMGCRGEKVWIG